VKLLALVFLAACTGGDVGAPCARHSDCIAPLRCSSTGTCEVAATTDGGVSDGDGTDGSSPDAEVADAAEVDAP
jgi:hypothetical protein